MILDEISAADFFLGVIVLAIAIYSFGRNSGFSAGTISSDVKSIKKEIKSLSKGIKKLNEAVFFQRINPSLNPLKTNSPRALSEVGKKISTKVGARKIADSIAPKQIARSHGLEEYDIEKECMEFLFNEFEPGYEIDRKIKDCAYNFGTGKDTVLLVIAIELRDIVLKATRS